MLQICSKEMHGTLKIVMTLSLVKTKPYFSSRPVRYGCSVRLLWRVAFIQHAKRVITVVLHAFDCLETLHAPAVVVNSSEFRLGWLSHRSRDFLGPRRPCRP